MSKLMDTIKSNATAAMPVATRARWDKQRIELNNQISQANDADKAQLMTARETLTRIARLAPQVQAGWLALLVAMLGMYTINQVDTETHDKMGTAVYAAMLMFAFYNTIKMAHLTEQKELYAAQRNKVAEKNKIKYR